MTKFPAKIHVTFVDCGNFSHCKISLNISKSCSFQKDLSQVFYYLFIGDSLYSFGLTYPLLVVCCLDECSSGIIKIIEKTSRAKCPFGQ